MQRSHRDRSRLQGLALSATARSLRFDSAWGVWSVAWTDSPRGPVVHRLGFPELGSTAGGGEASASVAGLVDRIRRHLSGDLQDFRDIELDLSGTTPFTRDVCVWIRSIPPGKVSTYGEVARAMGKPGASRAIGQALSRNPIGLVVPCHRVVGAGGLTGFSAPGGVATKERLLRLERALI